MFGPHLILDCYECDKQRLADKKFILGFLNELVSRIGMTKISGPHLIEYPENKGGWDKGGVSAVVIIAESHVSIHTFPEPEAYMNLDVFSCKSFDAEKVIKLVKKGFSAQKIEKKLLMRGKHFPKEELLSIKAARAQRKEVIK